MGNTKGLTLKPREHDAIRNKETVGPTDIVVRGSKETSKDNLLWQEGVVTTNLLRLPTALERTKCEDVTVSRLAPDKIERLISFLDELTNRTAGGMAREAANLVVQDGTEEFRFSEELISTVVGEDRAGVPLAYTYIMAVRQLCREGALPPWSAVSSTTLRLLFYLTGAAWSSAATSATCRLLAEATTGQLALKKFIIREFGRVQTIEYTFHQVALIGRGTNSFYKLAAAADRFYENPTAKAVLGAAGLLDSKLKLLARSAMALAEEVPHRGLTKIFEHTVQSVRIHCEEKAKFNERVARDLAAMEEKERQRLLELEKRRAEAMSFAEAIFIFNEELALSAQEYKWEMDMERLSERDELWGSEEYVRAVQYNDDE